MPIKQIILATSETTAVLGIEDFNLKMLVIVVGVGVAAHLSHNLWVYGPRFWDPLVRARSSDADRDRQKSFASRSSEGATPLLNSGHKAVYG